MLVSLLVRLLVRLLVVVLVQVLVGLEEAHQYKQRGPEVVVCQALSHPMLQITKKIIKVNSITPEPFFQLEG